MLAPEWIIAMKHCNSMDLGVEEMKDTMLADPALKHQCAFPFFDLPSELRLRIYEMVLLQSTTIDLDPTNYRTTAPLIRCFLVSKRMHDEATRVFYGSNTFRIFPIHGRFFHHKSPLLARLPSHYRCLITKLELRLGPGWTKPPRSWTMDGRLGLENVAKVRTLKIFVQCDPASDPIFEGFRVGQDFYTDFCVDLVRSFVSQVPSLREVEFDAWSPVKKSSPLMHSLLVEVKGLEKRISWGPERKWDAIVEANDISIIQFLQNMRLGRSQQ